MFNRLCIGTANWRKEYNGCLVPFKEQDKILEYCIEVGIWGIETAVDYNTHDISVLGDMKKIVKISAPSSPTSMKSEKVYCLMAHNSQVLLDFRCGKYSDKTGISVYGWDEVPQLVMKNIDVIEFPYSIMDRRPEEVMNWLYGRNYEIIVRSIYLRGKCLEVATPQECLQFVLCNPSIDRVVIGCDSLDQLKENTDFIHKWNSLRCDDDKVVDPRRWTD